MTVHQLIRTMVGRVPRSSRAFSAGTTMMGRINIASSAQLAPALTLRQGGAVTSNQSHFLALPAATNRLFSSSSVDDLSSRLARELAEEEEDGALEMAPGLVDLKEELSKDWTIVDDGETGTVKMFSKSGRVSIIFHCQDTMEVEFDDDDEDDAEDEASPEVRFAVTVQKAGRTMVMNCISVEANAVVETVAVTMEDVEAIHASGKVSDKLYQGPQFSELAEDLQEAFTAFVQTECGIHTNVAAFISMYADFKEQEEYIRWLKQVKDIID
jgi:complement component 1 Q subcomponent-binding protein